MAKVQAKQDLDSQIFMVKIALDPQDFKDLCWDKAIAFEVEDVKIAITLDKEYHNG